MCHHQLNGWAEKNDEKVRCKYQPDREDSCTWAVCLNTANHRKTPQITANHRNSPQIRFKWLQGCRIWLQISVNTANQTATYVKGCCYPSSLHPCRHSPQLFSTHVRCTQTAGWTKMPPTPKRAQGLRQSPQFFGPCVLWLYGCMDQDAICCGDKW